MWDEERETVEMGMMAARCAMSVAAAGLYPASAGRGMACACPSTDASPHGRSTGLSLRQVLVVGNLYLNLDYATSVFSLTFDHQHSSSSLQYPTNSHISISYVSLLSNSQHHHYRLDHFRIYFVDNEFEKSN
jgi:hypothetical protein